MSSKKDILFASLLGNKVAQSIPRFNAVQNELAKHVLPPIPFLPLRQEVGLVEVDKEPEGTRWEADLPTPTEKQFFPLSFAFESNQRKYLLPYEPMISINGGHTIIRRNVAKSGRMIGSVKERWSQNDYEITITGVLIGSIMTGDVSDCYPIRDFTRLLDFLTKAKVIYVFSEPLQNLGINQIVIESFTFPFTKGENVQAYEIKAYSDHTHNLLIPISEDA
ncbi:DUF6046 domain-containing protein [Aquimarina algiphila]|uniref:DUF6046 domain-containing protein n=1 Tax=Aquimarina algiphila TaxID=2047982 RepID=UPI00232AE457|nr:DUF6046 domain-containing protein [Aquimarina algiphila]